MVTVLEIARDIFSVCNDSLGGKRQQLGLSSLQKYLVPHKNVGY